MEIHAATAVDGTGIPEVELSEKQILGLILKANTLCVSLDDIMENTVAMEYCKLLGKIFDTSKEILGVHKGKRYKAVVSAEFEASLQPSSVIRGSDLIRASRQNTLNRYITDMCNIQMWATFNLYIDGQFVWHSALLDTVSNCDVDEIDEILNCMGHVAIEATNTKFKSMDTNIIWDISFPDEVCGNFDELIEQSLFYGELSGLKEVT